MTTSHPRRQHLTAADLAPLAREAVGGHRALLAATRLTGGTSKGVYRLAFDDGSTAIAYVWSPQEDYWAPPAADGAGTRSGATGLARFRSAHARLTDLGVRVPRLLLADGDAAHLPVSAAVVEDVTGGTLEDALRENPARGHAALERLAGMLAVMRAAGEGHGPVPGGPGVRAVADRAVRDIDEVSARDPRVREARDRLTERVRELRDAVRPRSAHSLIHGELGPDHVLLTEDGEPVLIDVEGLEYADVEREHVFLDLRFGPWYDALRAPGLDEARLGFYRLAMHLSLVAGPLRLLDGDFPDPVPMREIAESNLRRALELAGCAGTVPRP